MTRNEIITEINKLYDENMLLGLENENLKENINKKIEIPFKEDNVLNLKVMSYGINVLFDNVFKSWNVINVKRDENNEIKITPFEEYCDRKIFSIPNEFSKNELIDILKDKLLEKYEEEKKYAIEKFKEKEEEKEE